MPFQVEPKAGPTINKPTLGSPTPQTAARDKAIAILMGKSEAPRDPAQDKIDQSAAAATKDDNKIVEETTEVVQSAEGQNDKVETAPESTAESAPDKPKEDTKGDTEEPLSQQFQLLARKEKALRVKAQAQEQAYKQREAQMTAREDAIKSKEAEYASKFISIDRLKDPVQALAMLEQYGLTYEALTEAAALRPQRDPYAQQQIEALRAEISALKGDQENTKKSVADQTQAQYTQALRQIRNEATALVTKDPAFETVKETGSVGDVVDLIERTFKEEGVLLSVEEAAQAVEEHLIEEAMKITRIKKIQQKLNAPVPTASKSSGQPAAQAGSSAAATKAPMKTLTNANSSPRQLTAKERAILAFKGELSKG